MGTRNICFHQEVDKKYTGCNLSTTELLDYALIGVRAIIRLETVNLNELRDSVEPETIHYICMY